MIFRGCIKSLKALILLAPRDGLEPPTQWLTATCSTAELPGNWKSYIKVSCRRPALFGGRDRNRTGIQGFAVLCITTLPPGHH
jgi:hypothetical protein